MADTDEGRFAWVDDEPGFYPNLTLVRGLDEDEVNRRFGGDPATSQYLTIDDIYGLQPSHFLEHRPFVSVCSRWKWSGSTERLPACIGDCRHDDPDTLFGLRMLELAERVMQTTIEQAWIRRPLRTVELPDSANDPYVNDWRVTLPNRVARQ